jgi:hypothetical protein
MSNAAAASLALSSLLRESAAQFEIRVLSDESEIMSCAGLTLPKLSRT